MNTLKLFLVSCIIILLAGCSEEIKPDVPDYYRIFTGQNKKTWKITKLVWTGQGKSDVNLSIEACDRDNSYVFYANKDNLFEIINGNVKCSTSESSTLLSDQWSFVNGAATLTITLLLYETGILPEINLPFYVIKATSKEMILEIYTDQDNTYSYQITMQSVSEE